MSGNNSGNNVLIGLTTSIILAFVGYVATYVNNLKISQRKDRLERINRQLSDLYGPLLSLFYAGDTAWRKFRERYRPNTPYFSKAHPPTEEEKTAFRLWMTEVFMPINIQMEQVIIKNADLLIENEMPRCLLDLLAHVAAYKPVIKKWSEGDFSEHTSVIDFPTIDLKEYITSSFVKIKQQQAKLLTRLNI